MLLWGIDAAGLAVTCSRIGLVSSNILCMTPCWVLVTIQLMVINELTDWLIEILID